MHLFKGYLANGISRGRRGNILLAKQAKPENKCIVEKIAVGDKLKKIPLGIRKTNANFFGGGVVCNMTKYALNQDAYVSLACLFDYLCRHKKKVKD